MTKSEIKKIVHRKTMQGNSFQEIFDELRMMIPNREYDLARIIARKPSLAQRRRLGLLNTLLCVLLLLFAVMKLVLSIKTVQYGDPEILRILLWLPAGSLMVMVGIYLWNLESYYFVPLLVLWGFLQLIRPLFVDFDPWVLPELALLVALMVLAFYIRPKIGGRYQRLGSAKTHADGRVETTQVIKWLN